MGKEHTYPQHGRGRCTCTRRISLQVECTWPDERLHGIERWYSGEAVVTAAEREIVQSSDFGLDNAIFEELEIYIIAASAFSP